MRVWAVSDIHTDYADNMAWLRELAKQQGGSAGGHCGSTANGSGSTASGGNGSSPVGEAFKQDVLLLAGDVSDAMETLEKTLEICVATFAHVFFVPGNHGGWQAGREVRGGAGSCADCTAAGRW